MGLSYTQSTLDLFFKSPTIFCISNKVNGTMFSNILTKVYYLCLTLFLLMSEYHTTYYRTCTSLVYQRYFLEYFVRLFFNFILN